MAGALCSLMVGMLCPRVLVHPAGGELFGAMPVETWHTAVLLVQLAHPPRLYFLISMLLLYDMLP
jgi:hypothetical protein